MSHEIETDTLKTSLLVDRQVPEFIREEHPLFISFLEAYYEFLETEQGSQNNDATKISKDLRFVQDVDFSIEAFENSFLNTYANLVPKDVVVDKAFLIKNLLPLYLAKGNQKSFEFLFRMFFGEEVELSFPKDQILRASDGEYSLERVLRIRDAISTYYVGDGVTDVFKLAQAVTGDEITVVINGVTQTSGFYVRKEEKKLFFNTAPSSGDDIRVTYDDFSESVLTNRKITGVTSNASAIIENAVPRLLEKQVSVELFIDRVTLTGTFAQSEQLLSNIVDEDNVLIEISCNTTSSLERINVIDGGNDYNVGDPVTITAGGFQTPAAAEVEVVRTGFTDNVSINFGGAGFEVSGIVRAGDSTNGFVTLTVTGVDSTGNNSPNTYSAFDTRIDSINVSNTLTVPDYGFPLARFPNQNLNTRILDCLTSNSVSDIGPMTSLFVLSSNATSNTLTFDAEGAKILSGNTTIDIKQFKSLGRFNISSGGSNYAVGDEIVFSGGAPGFGAAAAVKEVDGNGAITQIEFQPSRISGTATIDANLNHLSGSGTLFGQELQVGDQIIINNQSRYINSIASNTSLSVNVNFNSITTGKKIGAYGRNPIGGTNFLDGVFPTVTIDTASGVGATVEVTALMGDSENVTATSNGTKGIIESIVITEPGLGYEAVPTIDLSESGDGTATAEALIQTSLRTFPGRWTSSKGIISASERKLQGLDYYQDYIYVTNVPVEFSKYKTILKGLVHPAGYKNYAEFNLTKSVETQIETSLSNTSSISGTVNVANTIFVTGTNTKFNIANGNTITTGVTQISVNNEIRTIQSIISNSNISVTSAFTQVATGQTIIIIV